MEKEKLTKENSKRVQKQKQQQKKQMTKVLGLNLATAITTLNVNGLLSILKIDVDRLKKKRHLYALRLI